MGKTGSKIVHHSISTCLRAMLQNKLYVFVACFVALMERRWVHICDDRAFNFLNFGFVGWGQASPSCCAFAPVCLSSLRYINGYERYTSGECNFQQIGINATVFEKREFILKVTFSLPLPSSMLKLPNVCFRSYANFESSFCTWLVVYQATLWSRR